MPLRRVLQAVRLRRRKLELRPRRATAQGQADYAPVRERCSLQRRNSDSVLRHLASIDPAPYLVV